MNRSTIDAGHGGVDSGATGLGYKEKDITLAMTLDVGTILEKHGMEINYTRKDDRYLSLDDRAKSSNKFNSDSFISIHVNSADNPAAHGLETFSDVGSIEGNKLATIMQNELVSQGLFTANRGVKAARFYVLRYTKAPAILIELCFIRNKADMDLLINNFEKFAQAIAKSILAYHNIEYIPHKPSNPDYSKDKVQVQLITDKLLVQGFNKDNINYVKVSNTYIPIRRLLEDMGFVVGYKDGTVTADLSSQYRPEEQNIRVILLDNLINLNGYKKDSTNLIKINNSYVPIRELFKPFGLHVDWKDNTVIVRR
ncbi:N-acetylmuramoyl-L-alanine amidase [Tissierellaceae bacterium HCP3S3_D8]